MPLAKRPGISLPMSSYWFDRQNGMCSVDDPRAFTSPTWGERVYESVNDLKHTLKRQLDPSDLRSKYLDTNANIKKSFSDVYHSVQYFEKYLSSFVLSTIVHFIVSGWISFVLQAVFGLCINLVMDTHAIHSQFVSGANLFLLCCMSFLDSNGDIAKCIPTLCVIMIACRMMLLPLAARYRYAVHQQEKYISSRPDNDIYSTDFKQMVMHYIREWIFVMTTASPIILANINQYTVLRPIHHFIDVHGQAHPSVLARTATTTITTIPGATTKTPLALPLPQSLSELSGWIRHHAAIYHAPLSISLWVGFVIFMAGFVGALYLSMKKRSFRNKIHKQVHPAGQQQQHAADNQIDDDGIPSTDDEDVINGANNDDNADNNSDDDIPRTPRATTTTTSNKIRHTDVHLYEESKEDDFSDPTPRHRYRPGAETAAAFRSSRHHQRSSRSSPTGPGQIFLHNDDALTCNSRQFEHNMHPDELFEHRLDKFVSSPLYRLSTIPELYCLYARSLGLLMMCWNSYQTGFVKMMGIIFTIFGAIIPVYGIINAYNAKCQWPLFKQSRVFQEYIARTDGGGALMDLLSPNHDDLASQSSA